MFLFFFFIGRNILQYYIFIFYHLISYIFMRHELFFMGQMECKGYVYCMENNKAIDRMGW